MFGPLRYGAVASIAGPAGSHRRHPAGEIEPREALAELPVDARTRRVIQVLVHHHEAGDDALASEIDYGRAFGCLHATCVTELGNEAVAQDDRLAFTRRRAGAVDDAHIGERDHGCIDLDEIADGVAELRRLSQQGGRCRDKRCGNRIGEAHDVC